MFNKEIFKIRWNFLPDQFEFQHCLQWIQEVLSLDNPFRIPFYVLEEQKKILFYFLFSMFYFKWSVQQNIQSILKKTVYTHKFTNNFYSIYICE